MGVQREASLSKERTQSKQGAEEEEEGALLPLPATAPRAQPCSHTWIQLTPGLAELWKTLPEPLCSVGMSPEPVEALGPQTPSTSVHPEPSLQCLTPHLGLEKHGTASWEWPLVRSTKVTPGQPPPVPEHSVTPSLSPARHTRNSQSPLNR